MLKVLICTWKHFIIFFFKTQIPKLFLSFGARDSAQDKRLRCCIHLAVEQGREETLMMLLRETGFSLVNIPDQKQRTSLHYASCADDPKVIHCSGSCSAIHSDGKLTIETSHFFYLFYGGQFTLSTHISQIFIIQWTNQNSNQIHVAAPSAGKRVRTTRNRFRFYFWLVEKVTRNVLISKSRSVEMQTNL